MQLINNFVMSLMIRLTSLREEKHEEGQTLVEYALIIALMSIALVASLELLADGVTGVFDDIIGTFS